jgi:hypothetical protein
MQQSDRLIIAAEMRAGGIGIGSMGIRDIGEGR